LDLVGLDVCRKVGVLEENVTDLEECKTRNNIYIYIFKDIPAIL